MDQFHLPVGELDGYEPCAPGQVAEEIDGSIAATATCPNCGHVGCLYSPWTQFRQHGHHEEGYISYRAFVACPRCGYIEEF